VVHHGTRVRSPMWVLLVGDTPALAPLRRHMKDYRTPWLVAGEKTREGWLGDVFVDIGIGPIFLSQRKRRMKCGIIGNWCCSDRAKCHYLRSHSLGLPCSVVLNVSVLHISWELALYGLVEYPSVIIMRMALARWKLMLSTSCTARWIMWATSWEVRVCEGDICTSIRSVYPSLAGRVATSVSPPNSIVKIVKLSIEYLN
jgi:hypothetical protein